MTGLAEASIGADIRDDDDDDDGAAATCKGEEEEAKAEADGVSATAADGIACDNTVPPSNSGYALQFSFNLMGTVTSPISMRERRTRC